MPVDTIQFVDSIASSPTVRLDINDGTTWNCNTFDPGLPRLRRAMSQNAMRDGGNVSSSTYDMRTLRLTLALVHTSEDNAATEVQKLARELDRTDNFIRYQPTGATKPVFFRTFRSDVSQLEHLTGAAKAFKKPSIEILAEPFALGLRETLGPFTVNNDPAAGSNGLFFDVTGVIGDIAAPAILQANHSSGTLERYGYLAVRQHGTPSSLTFFLQAESASLLTDTTNPGGGPDAVMSGAGVNNFVRTSFATATMTNRFTATISAKSVEARGRYRILVAARRSDNTSAMSMRVSSTGSGTPGSTVTLPLVTNRIIVDLGLFDARALAPDRVGYGADVATNKLVVTVQAARASGTGTLDFDYIAAIPADESMLLWDVTTDSLGSFVFDGVSQSVCVYETGVDPFTAGPYMSALSVATPFAVSGGFPSLEPNQTNRFYMVTIEETNTNHVKGDSNVVSVHYWPRYLFVRPSAT